MPTFSVCEALDIIEELQYSFEYEIFADLINEEKTEYTLVELYAILYKYNERKAKYFIYK